MLTDNQARKILQTAELLYSAEAIEKTVQRMADEITAKLADQNPLVLCVMKGGAVLAGHLLPRLVFPLSFDYVQVSRYHNRTSGGATDWRIFPQEDLKDRTVLIIDDILDEGITLAEIHNKVLDYGARACYSAVLADKAIGKTKPMRADFVGLTLPDRYVFGFGMDIHGAWRNLPAIYALHAELDN